MGGGTHADPATGAFGGAPYGATNRARGAPKLMAIMVTIKAMMMTMGVLAMMMSGFFLLP